MSRFSNLSVDVAIKLSRTRAATTSSSSCSPTRMLISKFVYEIKSLDKFPVMFSTLIRVSILSINLLIYIRIKYGVPDIQITRLDDLMKGSVCRKNLESSLLILDALIPMNQNTLSFMVTYSTQNMTSRSKKTSKHDC